MKGAESLQFAVPTTVISETDVVRLIAGEDLRFTLRGRLLHAWLPELLERLDGRASINSLLGGLPEDRRAEALALLERLVGERLLFSAESLPESFEAVALPEGSGHLFDCVQSLQPSATTSQHVRVLCQDTLDYAAALDFNEACRAGQAPWLWATLGPSARAFISPVFWPDLGPCIACLLDSFQRLSPAPELYEALLRHAKRGGKFSSAAFPAPGVAMVANLVHWKVASLAQPEAPPAVSRLHVLEVASMELQAHRIPRDLECTVCGGALQAGTD